MYGIIGKFATVTPGTPIRLTSTQADPAAKFSCHGVLIQALKSNVGVIYIGKSGLVRSTYANVGAVLGIPTTNFLPSFTVALTLAPNSINLSDFYIDSDNAGDGVLVSVLIA